MRSRSFPGRAGEYAQRTGGDQRVSDGELMLSIYEKAHFLTRHRWATSLVELFGHAVDNVSGMGMPEPADAAAASAGPGNATDPERNAPDL